MNLRFITWGGLAWQIKYVVGEDDITTVHDVRILDEQFNPVGPNMVDFLDRCFYLPQPEGADAWAVLGEMSDIVRTEKVN